MNDVARISEGVIPKPRTMAPVPAGEAYSWPAGFTPPVTAATFKAELDKLAKQLGHNPSPAEVVDAAKEPKHPLHVCFTWNEAAAARAHWIEQARSLIRNLRVTFTRGPVVNVPLRALFSVKVEGQRTYIEARAAMSSAEFRKQILRDALRDVRAFSSKYGHLLSWIGADTQASELGAAIERALVEH